MFSTTHSLMEALPSSVSEIRAERANADIKDMLVAWLSYNNKHDWSLGLRLIQNQKNSAYHAGIKCRPTLSKVKAKVEFYLLHFCIHIQSITSFLGTVSHI